MQSGLLFFRPPSLHHLTDCRPPSKFYTNRTASMGVYIRHRAVYPQSSSWTSPPFEPGCTVLYNNSIELSASEAPLVSPIEIIQV